MYAFPSMLEMTNQVWPSDDHRIVAEHALICNPRYKSMTDLMHGAEIIAAIPQETIRFVTPADLQSLGVMF